MNQIKFRGVNVNDQRWRYGQLVKGTIDSHMKIIDYGIQEEGYYPSEIDKESIGQYIGRKDKNDREIFTGDFVLIRFYHGSKNTHVMLREVAYSEPRLCVLFQDSRFCKYQSLNDIIDQLEEFQPMSVYYDIEVIGNTYENDWEDMRELKENAVREVLK